MKYRIVTGLNDGIEQFRVEICEDASNTWGNIDGCNWWVWRNTEREARNDITAHKSREGYIPRIIEVGDE
jgi:hypothetical protein